jgi:hypothetical protein
MVASDKLGVFIPSLTADQERIYKFETGYSPPNTSFGFIPGTGGYVTVADSSALELGSNFTVEQKGWVDTSAGSNKNLVYKESAFKTYVNGTSNVSSAIVVNHSLIDTGATNLTKLSSYYYTRAGQRVDNFPVSTITRVDFQLAKNGTPTGTATVNVRVVSSDSVIGTLGTIDVSTISATYTWYSFTTPVSITSAQNIRIAIEYSGGGDVDYIVVRYHSADVISGYYFYYAGTYTEVTSSETTIRIYYDTETTVTATSISSGEHTVKTTYDGANLKIFVDDMVTPKDTTAWAGSVPDNANNWLLMQNNVMPCMEYYKHTVGGTLIAHYQPNAIISGATLLDREGTAQDGTITWGTNSNLVVSVGGLKSITSYSSTPTEEGEPQVVVPAPEEISGFIEGESEPTSLPWYDLFRKAAIGNIAYSAGTVTGTQGTETLTGSGTNWVSGYQGYSITVGGYTYTIDKVTSPTSLTLTTNLSTSPSGDTYVIRSPSLQWGTRNLYGVMAIFVGIGMGVGVAIATGSFLLATIAVGVSLAVGAGQGVLGWWVVLVYGLFAAAYLGVTKSI